jgi:hypothetical protein
MWSRVYKHHLFVFINRGRYKQVYKPVHNDPTITPRSLLLIITVIISLSIHCRNWHHEMYNILQISLFKLLSLGILGSLNGKAFESAILFDVTPIHPESCNHVELPFLLKLSHST